MSIREGDIWYRHEKTEETDDGWKCQPLFYQVVRTTKSSAFVKRVEGRKCNGKNACTVRSPVRIGDEEERVKFKDMEADWHRWEGGDVANMVEEKEWLEVVI